MYVDHHHAHAASGWLDSPFYYRQAVRSNEVTVVLSFDGFGNDGYLRTFTGRPGNATLLPLGDSMQNHSFGEAYLNAAMCVRDLACFVIGVTTKHQVKATYQTQTGKESSNQ